MSAKKLKQQHKNHKHIIKVNIMREEYDFSESKKNPYASELKEYVAFTRTKTRMKRIRNSDELIYDTAHVRKGLA